MMLGIAPWSFAPMRLLFVHFMAALMLVTVVDVPFPATAATPRVSITPSATRVSVGESVRFAVAVRRGAPRQEVTLQRKQGTRWARVATKYLPREGRIKRVAFTRTLSTRGYHT